MKTSFPRFNDDFPSKWASFFNAGTDWLQIFELLEDERKKETFIFLFWAYPYVLFFSLELFVKSLVAHENPNFDAKRDGFYHNVTKIISFYKDRIPVLKDIADNKELFDLIKEYENTVDTKFGETAVKLDGEETALMLETVYKLRNEMCKKTGLR